MFTRCPKCHALYELGVPELRAGGGEVLCGQCRIIFSALHSLADSAAEATPNPQSRLKIPLLDAVVDAQAAETPLVYAPAAGPAQDEDDEAQEEFPDDFVYAQPSASPLWTLASLGAVALLLWQGWHFEHDRLARDERYRPWMETACRLAGCVLPVRRDLARIEILDRQLNPAEGTVDGLEFHTVLANYADFPQPFPRLKLSLTYFDGDPIAQRIFPPEEYLPAELAAKAMPVGESFEIKLLLAPPEKTVGGFTIELL
ncbi:MAG TPA: zinc-ribbon and DUF3426 domain-containing protein [Methylococcaceae bacterium]|nr:zinc-ribbon and DUF3426 domain-containing protein [Methylococcaceae bacterium]